MPVALCAIVRLLLAVKETAVVAVVVKGREGAAGAATNEAAEGLAVGVLRCQANPLLLKQSGWDPPAVVGLGEPDGRCLVTPAAVLLVAVTVGTSLCAGSLLVVRQTLFRVQHRGN